MSPLSRVILARRERACISATTLTIGSGETEAFERLIEEAKKLRKSALMQ
jgi:hypothetical protein